MVIKNVEIDFDLMDVDTAAKYEAAVKKMQDSAAKIGTDSLSQNIAKQCDIIYTFFVDILGDETTAKILGGKRNLKRYIDVADEFISAVSEQNKDLQKALDKYSPARLVNR